MAIEQFPNGPTATLNGGIDGVTNTVNITPVSGTWPAGPQYRLLMESELGLVTGVSGNQLTVTRGIEGTTAVAHSNGVAVSAVPTGGGLTFAFARVDQNNSGPGNFTTLSATGLYSQVQTASRQVGSVAPGAGTAWTPAGGPYSVGDMVQDISNAVEYICTGAGSPGTWIAAPSLTLTQTFTKAQTISLANILSILNRTDGAAALMTHQAVQRAGVTKFGLGLDASDQFAVLNAALNAINLGLTDLGIAAFRNAVNFPPSAGASLPSVSYATVQNKVFESSGSAIATLTVSGLPGTAKTLDVDVEARTDQAGGQGFTVQFNSDTAANYDWMLEQMTNVTNGAPAPTIAGTSGRFGMLGASGAAAGMTPFSAIRIGNADSTTLRKGWVYSSQQFATDAAANTTHELGMGQWRNTTSAITAIKFLPTAGNFATIRARGYQKS